MADGNGERPCAYCGGAISKDEAYAYVEVHLFRQFLEPATQRVARLHWRCYNVACPDYLPYVELPASNNPSNRVGG